jgi:hypothetical protein
MYAFGIIFRRCVHVSRCPAAFAHFAATNKGPKYLEVVDTHPSINCTICNAVWGNALGVILPKFLGFEIIKV